METRSTLAFVASGVVAGCGLASNGLLSAGGPGVDASSPPSIDACCADAARDASALAVPDAVSPADGGVASVDAPLDAPLDSPPDTPATLGAGDALQFSGGAYVAVGALPIPADFTLEAWVNPAAETGETYFLAEDKNGQGQGQFRFGITSGKPFFMMTDAGGQAHGLYNGAYAVLATQALPASAWSHVAVTKSGAAFALYVDGTSVATFTATAVFAYGGPSVAFRIAGRVGSDGTSIDGAFDGTLDEVRVWNVARTPAEIAGAMRQTVDPSTTGLLAYWRFDEGTGSSAGDQEGRYPGTLVAGPLWVPSTAF